MATVSKQKTFIRSPVSKENVKAASKIPVLQKNRFLKKKEEPEIKTAVPEKVYPVKPKRPSNVGLIKKLKNSDSVLTKETKTVNTKDSSQFVKGINEKLKKVKPPPIKKSEIQNPEKKVNSKSSFKPFPAKKVRNSSTTRGRNSSDVSMQKNEKKSVRPKLNEETPSTSYISKLKIQKSENSVLGQKLSGEIQKSESQISDSRSLPNLSQEFQNIFQTLKARASSEKEKKDLDHQKPQLEMMYYGIAKIVPQRINTKNLISAGHAYKQSQSKFIEEKNLISTNEITFLTGGNDLENNLNATESAEVNLEIGYGELIDDECYREVENLCSQLFAIDMNEQNIVEEIESISDERFLEVEDSQVVVFESSDSKSCEIIEIEGLVYENEIEIDSGSDNSHINSLSSCDDLIILSVDTNGDGRNYLNFASQDEFISDIVKLNVRQPLSPIFEERSSDFSSLRTDEIDDKEGAVCFKEIDRRDIFPQTSNINMPDQFDSESFFGSVSVESTLDIRQNVSTETFSVESPAFNDINEISLSRESEAENENSSCTTLKSTYENDNEAKKEQNKSGNITPQSNNQGEDPCCNELNATEKSPEEIEGKETVNIFDVSNSFSINVASSVPAELQFKPIYNSKDIVSTAGITWKKTANSMNMDMFLSESKATIENSKVMEQTTSDETTRKLQNILESGNEPTDSSFKASNPILNKDDILLIQSKFETITSILQKLKLRSCHDFKPTSVNEVILNENLNFHTFESVETSGEQEKVEIYVQTSLTPTSSSSRISFQSSRCKMTEDNSEISAENWMKAFIHRMSKAYDLPEVEQSNSTQMDNLTNQNKFDNTNSDPTSLENNTYALLHEIENKIEQIRIGLTELCKKCDKTPRRRIVKMPERRKLFTRIAEVQTSNPETDLGTELTVCPTCAKVLCVDIIKHSRLNSHETCSQNAKCEMDTDVAALSCDKHVTWDTSNSDGKVFSFCNQEDEGSKNSMNSESEDSKHLTTFELEVLKDSKTFDIEVHQLPLKQINNSENFRSLNVLENCSADHDNKNKNSLDGNQNESKNMKDFSENLPPFRGCPCMIETYEKLVQSYRNLSKE